MTRSMAGGRTMFDASLYAGHLDAAARMLDDLSARSSGDFVKAAYMLNRLQRLTDEDTLSMTLSGQWAGNNLSSSEKYSLGGVYGIRAYPQGEASGDMGGMLKLELAHHFSQQLRGSVFYDYGHIRINQDEFSEADNTRTLSGAGLGLNAALYGCSWMVMSPGRYRAVTLCQSRNLQCIRRDSGCRCPEIFDDINLCAAIGY